MYVNVKVVGVRAVSKMTAGTVERSIVYTLAPGDDRIELSTGEIFGRLTANPDAVRGTLLVTEQTTEQVELGKLHYIRAYKPEQGKPDPAELHFEMALPVKGFASLWEMAVWSGMPDQFLFNLDGMDYGYSPDGHDLNWDVERSKELLLNEVTWYLDGGKTHFNT